MATKKENRRTDFVNMYRDGAGKFRWQRKAKNGEIVSDSGQGYASDEFCEQRAKEVNDTLLDFRWVPWEDQEAQIDGPKA